MPGRELQRLDSYQKGDGVGAAAADDDLSAGIDDGVVAVVPDGTSAPPSSGGTDPARPAPPPSLLAQFSLVGHADDVNDPNLAAGAGLMERRAAAAWWARLAAAGVGFIALMAVLVILSGPSNEADGSTAGDGGTSTPPSSPACPANGRYSYSVSPEIMELKNSSTGEFAPDRTSRD